MHLARLLFAAITLLSTPVLAQSPPFRLEVVADGLSEPLFLTSPAGDPRLFVVEQTGAIRIIAGGRVLATPFLDLEDRVSGGNEQGLLGLAFDPSYASNGRFFINMTDRNGDTNIIAFRVSTDPNIADPDSAELVLFIDQPQANHNGGWLGFGPDGYLYVGMGDGGGAGDRENNAQNPNSLLGKMLRLDINAKPYAIPPTNPYAKGGGAPEIFASGVRNPWRNAFDGETLFIGDVGQNKWEEIDAISTGDAGANLGWRVMEGEACYNPANCDVAPYVKPIHVYSHDDGCSVTGGYVYRGEAIPAVAGRYFFADYCAGILKSLVYSNGRASDVQSYETAFGAIGNITSFGEDSARELYILTGAGSVLRLAPAN